MWRAALPELEPRLVIAQPFALVCQAMVYVHLSGRTEDFLPAPAV